MEPEQEPIRGRGASSNPANRFELIPESVHDGVSASGWDAAAAV